MKYRKKKSSHFISKCNYFDTHENNRLVWGRAGEAGEGGPSKKVHLQHQQHSKSENCFRWRQDSFEIIFITKILNLLPRLTNDLGVLAERRF
jgi:hypothetical protein